MAKPPLTLWHWYVITSHFFTWRKFLIHALILMVFQLISIGKSGTQIRKYTFNRTNITKRCEYSLGYTEWEALDKEEAERSWTKYPVCTILTKKLILSDSKFCYLLFQPIFFIVLIVQLHIKKYAVNILLSEQSEFMGAYEFSSRPNSKVNIQYHCSHFRMSKLKWFGLSSISRHT